jgi:ABC-type phosphate transport system ATPase subunit
LLVDEPESSFDNKFLLSDVNQIIKDISQTMPVVVVTHNSTVGASAGADYLLFASKEIVGSNIEYQLYSGYPTDLQLCSPDGRSVSNYTITLNSLEAGHDAYDGRRQGYEAIKDRT